MQKHDLFTMGLTCPDYLTRDVYPSRSKPPETHLQFIWDFPVIWKILRKCYLIDKHCLGIINSISESPAAIS